MVIIYTLYDNFPRLVFSFQINDVEGGGFRISNRGHRVHELTLLTNSNKHPQKFRRFFHFKEICYEEYNYWSNHLLHSVAEQNLQIVSKDNHVRRNFFLIF